MTPVTTACPEVGKKMCFKKKQNLDHMVVIFFHLVLRHESERQNRRNTAFSVLSLVKLAELGL